MNMAKVHWKSGRLKKTLGCIVIALLLYYFARKGEYEYRSNVFVKGSKPYSIWEYVSDFSHMKYLNPTITGFQILSDQWTNNGVWHYSVEYSENLSHWPYSHNVAIAHYKSKGDLKLDEYVIESTHKTCLFRGHYCLDTFSVFKFYKNAGDDGTICEEIIQYQCPIFLSGFCRREVEYQRRAIGTNLQKMFNV